MHTTKDKLTAYTTMWLIAGLISFAFIAPFDVWGLIAPLFCLFMSTVKQTELEQWLSDHTSDDDIKMWADQDRPE